MWADQEALGARAGRQAPVRRQAAALSLPVCQAAFSLPACLPCSPADPREPEAAAADAELRARGGYVPPVPLMGQAERRGLLSSLSLAAASIAPERLIRSSAPVQHLLVLQLLPLLLVLLTGQRAS